MESRLQWLNQFGNGLNIPFKFRSQFLIVQEKLPISDDSFRVLRLLRFLRFPPFLDSQIFILLIVFKLRSHLYSEKKNFKKSLQIPSGYFQKTAALSKNLKKQGTFGSDESSCCSTSPTAPQSTAPAEPWAQRGTSSAALSAAGHGSARFPPSALGRKDPPSWPESMTSLVG